jgi:hypothetical protein
MTISDLAAPDLMSGSLARLALAFSFHAAADHGLSAGR